MMLFSKNAEPYRKKLWDYALKSFSQERLYVDISPLLFLLVGLSIIKQKAIVILDEPLIPLVTSSGCSLAGRDITKIPDLVRLLQEEERLKQLMKLANIDQDVQDQVIEYARLNDLNIYSPPEVLVHSSSNPTLKESCTLLILKS